MFQGVAAPNLPFLNSAPLLSYLLDRALQRVLLVAIFIGDAPADLTLRQTLVLVEALLLSGYFDHPHHGSAQLFGVAPGPGLHGSNCHRSCLAGDRDRDAAQKPAKAFEARHHVV